MFVSLDDDIYRVYGHESVIPKLKRVADRLPEGVAIKDPGIGRCLDELVRKVNFENQAARRETLQYDAVLNVYRERLTEWRSRIFESFESPEQWRKTAVGLIHQYTNAVALNNSTGENTNSEMPLDALFTHSANVYDRQNELPASPRDIPPFLYEARYQCHENKSLAEFEQQELLRIMDDEWARFLAKMELAEDRLSSRGFDSDPLPLYRIDAAKAFKETNHRITARTVKNWFLLIRQA